LAEGLNKTIDIPDGTDIEANSGQTCQGGWDTECTLIERVRPEPAPDAQKEDDGGCPNFTALAGGDPWTPSNPDFRDATLRLNLGSIKSTALRCDSALNWNPLPTVAHPSDFTRKTQIRRGPGRRR